MCRSEEEALDLCRIREDEGKMTGIIITGHGHFPTGLLSAVSLVAGKPEKVEAVDFTEGMSSEELKGQLKEAAGRLEEQEILILADLTGGTPFNMAAAIKMEETEKHFAVVSGANMPALVEGVFSRVMYGSLEELAAGVMKAGKEGLCSLEALAAGEEEEAPEFEDGL